MSAECPGQTTERLPATGYRLPTTDYRLPATGYRLPTADYQLRAQAEAALERAVDALLRLQDSEGWWCGELEANVTIQAEYILLMQFLGLRDENRWADVVRYIDSRQQSDGGWPIYYGGPSDLSTTIEAYVALKLAGRDPDSEMMQKVRRLILQRGSLPKARIFTKIWLALFGEYPWDGLPVMPPELMFLPPWVPLNIYDFSCWARGTIVPLLIVMTKKPVRPLPQYACVPELRVGLTGEDYGLPKPDRMRSWRGTFWLLDRLLRHVSFPQKPRRRAMRLAEQWVLEHQEADGSWGGIQPPWVYSLIAFSTLGYPTDHPVIEKSLAGMEDFGWRDDDGWRVQPCASPVWDTALALNALLDAGVEVAHPAIQRAIQWLLAKQLFAGGDWQVRAGRTPPGGWSFEFFNDGYPDTDDTSIVILALDKALRRLPDPNPGNPHQASSAAAGEGLFYPGPARSDVDKPTPWMPVEAKLETRNSKLETAELRSAIKKAVRWLEGMRSRNGAWGSFDVDNTRSLVTKIPFCDFGETIDPPTEDVTAHIVECLAELGYSPGHPVLRHAIDYLLAAQQSDGSWWGRWGVNYLYGIGAVLPALRATGLPPRHPAIVRAADWLRRHQLPDGGWGETTHSYEDKASAGGGPSTPSQTAWALLGLIAADEATSKSAARGIRFLVECQREDGTWDEPDFTGTGFPRAFMINYHLYRQYFPTMALGRWLKRSHEA